MKTYHYLKAKYQGLTWFQDANGDYFYQENGQYVKFDLSKPVGVDNGVNVYYHPVNKVLYTLDANGQAQQYTPRPWWKKSRFYLLFSFWTLENKGFLWYN